jgi:hypothetical protein
MLPSNFDTSIEKRPDLRPVLSRVSEWILGHQDWELIDPRILSKDLFDINPLWLAKALEALVEDGALEQVYMLASPSTGVLASGEYRDLNELPEGNVWDRSHYVNADDAEIVAVLKSA